MLNSMFGQKYIFKINTFNLLHGQCRAPLPRPLQEPVAITSYPTSQKYKTINYYTTNT